MTAASAPRCPSSGSPRARTSPTATGRADLVVGNNVFAHVPDLLDFVRGLRALVADDGTVSLEFPHLLRLIEGRQYDTIYHEHYSYFTLRTAAAALATGGPAGRGRGAAHARRIVAGPRQAVGARGNLDRGSAKVLADEEAAGLHTVEGHSDFARAVLEVKPDLVTFLVDAVRRGRTIAGYGAPGKGNTLLNHCGVRSDLLQFTVDRNPYKQGLYLPGSHIPVLHRSASPRCARIYVLVLPWNLRDEVLHQLSYAREWGAQFVVPIPRLEII